MSTKDDDLNPNFDITEDVPGVPDRLVCRQNPQEDVTIMSKHILKEDERNNMLYQHTEIENVQSNKGLVHGTVRYSANPVEHTRAGGYGFQQYTWKEPDISEVTAQMSLCPPGCSIPDSLQCAASCWSEVVPVKKTADEECCYNSSHPGLLSQNDAGDYCLNPYTYNKIENTLHNFAHETKQSYTSDEPHCEVDEGSNIDLSASTMARNREDIDLSSLPHAIAITEDYKTLLEEKSTSDGRDVLYVQPVYSFIHSKYSDESDAIVNYSVNAQRQHLAFFNSFPALTNGLPSHIAERKGDLVVGNSSFPPKMIDRSIPMRFVHDYGDSSFSSNDRTNSDDYELHESPVVDNNVGPKDNNSNSCNTVAWSEVATNITVTKELNKITESKVRPFLGQFVGIKERGQLLFDVNRCCYDRDDYSSVLHPVQDQHSWMPAYNMGMTLKSEKRSLKNSPPEFNQFKSQIVHDKLTEHYRIANGQCVAVTNNLHCMEELESSESTKRSVEDIALRNGSDIDEKIKNTESENQNCMQMETLKSGDDSVMSVQSTETNVNGQNTKITDKDEPSKFLIGSGDRGVEMGELQTSGNSLSCFIKKCGVKQKLCNNPTVVCQRDDFVHVQENAVLVNAPDIESSGFNTTTDNEMNQTAVKYCYQKLSENSVSCTESGNIFMVSHEMLENRDEIISGPIGIDQQAEVNNDYVLKVSEDVKAESYIIINEMNINAVTLELEASGSKVIKSDHEETFDQNMQILHVHAVEDHSKTVIKYCYVESQKTNGRTILLSGDENCLSDVQDKSLNLDSDQLSDSHNDDFEAVAVVECSDNEADELSETSKKDVTIQLAECSDLFTSCELASGSIGEIDTMTLVGSLPDKLQQISVMCANGNDFVNRSELSLTVIRDSLETVVQHDAESDTNQTMACTIYSDEHSVLVKPLNKDHDETTRVIRFDDKSYLMPAVEICNDNNCRIVECEAATINNHAENETETNYDVMSEIEIDDEMLAAVDKVGATIEVISVDQKLIVTTLDEQKVIAVVSADSKMIETPADHGIIEESAADQNVIEVPLVVEKVIEAASTAQKIIEVSSAGENVIKLTVNDPNVAEVTSEDVVKVSSGADVIEVTFPDDKVVKEISTEQKVIKPNSDDVTGLTLSIENEITVNSTTETFNESLILCERDAVVQSIDLEKDVEVEENTALPPFHDTDSVVPSISLVLFCDPSSSAALHCNDVKFSQKSSYHVRDDDDCGPPKKMRKTVHFADPISQNMAGNASDLVEGDTHMDVQVDSIFSGADELHFLDIFLKSRAPGVEDIISAAAATSDDYDDNDDNIAAANEDEEEQSKLPHIDELLEITDHKTVNDSDQNVPSIECAEKRTLEPHEFFDEQIVVEINDHDDVIQTNIGKQNYDEKTLYEESEDAAKLCPPPNRASSSFSWKYMVDIHQPPNISSSSNSFESYTSSIWPCLQNEGPAVSAVIPALHTCHKPLRLGLSKKHIGQALHPTFNKQT